MAHLDLTGKVALITGANNPMGIGAATASTLARAGAKVFITYLRAPAEQEHTFAVSGQQPYVQGEEQPSVPGWARYSFLRMQHPADVLEAIAREGGVAAAWEADLAEAEAVPALFDRVESGFGPVAILVNNAAHCCAADTVDALTAEVIDRTYAVNLRAPLLLIAEYVQRYKRQGLKSGRIVNLSTGPAQQFAHQITYGTSKAALEAATRAAAVELGPLGITVNAVAPGPIQTGYISPDAERELLPRTPVRRLGQPDDIADAIAYLCSDRAGYISGQVLRVTGGRDLG